MIKELNSLVKDNLDKKVNDDFVHDAYDIIRNGNPELRDFLLGIHVDDVCEEDPHTNGEYFPITGDINVYLNTVDEFNVSNEFKHYLIIRTIEHEIEHARSVAKYMEHKNDIESIVTKHCVVQDEFSSGTGRPKFRHNLYIYDPHERIANIRSTKFIINLLKNYKDSESLDLARYLLFISYMRGYEDNGYYLEPPTYTYLRRNNMGYEEGMLSELVKNTGFSLDSRLLYGLPISYDEVPIIISDKAKVRKPEMIDAYYSKFNN